MFGLTTAGSVTTGAGGLAGALVGLVGAMGRLGKRVAGLKRKLVPAKLTVWVVVLWCCGTPSVGADDGIPPVGPHIPLLLFVPSVRPILNEGALILHY